MFHGAYIVPAAGYPCRARAPRPPPPPPRRQKWRLRRRLVPETEMATPPHVGSIYFLPLDRVQVSIFQAPVPTWLAGSISDSIQTGRKSRVKVRRFAVGGHGALSPIAPNLATHLVTCIWTGRRLTHRTFRPGGSSEQGSALPPPWPWQDFSWLHRDCSPCCSDLLLAIADCFGFLATINIIGNLLINFLFPIVLSSSLISHQFFFLHNWFI